VLGRRHFLTTAATGVAASIVLRSTLMAQLERIPPLPDRSLLDKSEDAYWAEMRKQFLILKVEIYLNNGTVGSSPAPLWRAVFDGYTTSERMDQQDPEDYPIWGYGPWNEFRDPLAALAAAIATRLPCCGMPPKLIAT
jgi:isopenicillin-N epimerase